MTRDIFLRFATRLVVAAAFSLGLAAVSHATEVKYSVGPGANSKALTLPENVPVSLTGNSTTSGDYGVGQATIWCLPTEPGLQWVGVSWYSAGTSYRNYYPNASNIVALDTDGFVFVNVDVASKCTLVIGNTGSVTATGTVIY